MSNMKTESSVLTYVHVLSQLLRVHGDNVIEYPSVYVTHT